MKHEHSEEVVIIIFIWQPRKWKQRCKVISWTYWKDSQRLIQTEKSYYLISNFQHRHNARLSRVSLSQIPTSFLYLALHKHSKNILSHHTNHVASIPWSLHSYFFPSSSHLNVKEKKKKKPIKKMLRTRAMLSFPILWSRQLHFLFHWRRICLVFQDWGRGLASLQRQGYTLCWWPMWETAKLALGEHW